MWILAGTDMALTCRHVSIPNLLPHVRCVKTMRDVRSHAPTFYRRMRVTSFTSGDVPNSSEIVLTRQLQPSAQKSNSSNSDLGQHRPDLRLHAPLFKSRVRAIPVTKHDREPTVAIVLVMRTKPTDQYRFSNNFDSDPKNQCVTMASMFFSGVTRLPTSGGSFCTDG